MRENIRAGNAKVGVLSTNEPRRCNLNVDDGRYF
jgi:hypothetical protein